MKCIKTQQDCECGTDTGPLCLIFGASINVLNAFKWIENYWEYTDYLGNKWKLNPTQDRNFPFIIEILEWK